MFHKSDKLRKNITVVAVHVDDCTIAASSTCLIDDFKAGLHTHVEVTVTHWPCEARMLMGYEAWWLLSL